MNRALGASRERGIKWGSVALGWLVAVIGTIVIGVILRSLYALSAGPSVEATEVGAAAILISLITGFLSYLLGGYVAGRSARVSGAVNGAMTAIFGLIVGLVLAIILFILALISAGVTGSANMILPNAPVGFGLGGGAFLAGLILLAVHIAAGYLGGKLGAPSER